MSDSNTKQTKDKLDKIYDQIRLRVSKLETEKEQLVREYRRALEDKGVKKVKADLHENT
jgi:hypothetical protein